MIRVVTCGSLQQHVRRQVTMEASVWFQNPATR